jgi:hypothetical protein
LGEAEGIAEGGENNANVNKLDLSLVGSRERTTFATRDQKQ